MAKAQRIKTGEIRVQGLDKLNRALREMGGEFPNSVRQANKSVAEDVRTVAFSRALALGGVAAHVAPSLRAVAGARSAGVAGGGARYPMFGGAEFGSIRYKQFKPWRGNKSNAGYFLYPAIRAEAPRITQEYLDELDALIKKAGLD